MWPESPWCMNSPIFVWKFISWLQRDEACKCMRVSVWTSGSSEDLNHQMELLKIKSANVKLETDM